MKKFTFIDLFCGIGGFRIALENNGGECVFSSDIDKWSRQTYFSNFKEVPKGDITQIKSKDIPNHNILCAGFPCQAFSLAGKRKGFEDTRGTLFFDVARILKRKKPDAFILENVRGITSHNKGETIKIIRNTLKKVGYTIFEKNVNAKNYGLPQNRERWICVGFKKEIDDFEFPEKEKLKLYVSNLLEKDITDYEASKIAMKHILHYYKKYNKRNKSQFTLATQARPSKCALRSDGISPCLTAKMGTGGNNIPVIVELKRKLTERECLRLMGFPEWFKMTKKTYQSYKQIGNSVPVNIIEKISKNVVNKII